MRTTMMFMSVAAVAALISYKPAMAAAEAGDTAKATIKVASANAPKRALQPVAKRLVARIDLSSQTMNVEVDGQTQHSWKISSGAANGYQTPTGSYTPHHMTTMHRSRKYDNAPMPHAVFFRGGYAVHATGATWALGRPASHGCVRLSPSNARTFYSLVQKYGKAGTTIRIAGSTPVKTSLRAKPAGSSSTSRSTSEPYFSWTSGYSYGNRNSPYTAGSRYGKRSYTTGSRVKVTRGGRRITQTWW